MARTFEQWMADNGLSTGYGANYIYGQNGAGGSGDRSTAVLNWQREEQANTLADLMRNLSSGGGWGSGGTTQGTRFDAGLADYEARLKALLDNPDSVTQTAGYKFRFNQGQEALNRSMAARGLANSGNRLMELTKYGQDMASQEYDNQANRLNALLGTYAQGYVQDKTANMNYDLGRQRNALSALSMMNQGGSLPVSRASSGTTWANPSAFQGSWDPETDPAIQRMRQARIDAARY